MSNIKIGTRGSKLALAQTKKVIDLLTQNGVEAEYVIIKTTGDKVIDRGLHEIGGFGMFVRELDNAILRGDIDCAVHSMKDIPAERPKGLVTATVLKRDPPYDYMVMNEPVENMTVIGTSSLRRKPASQIYQNRPVRVECFAKSGYPPCETCRGTLGQYCGARSRTYAARIPEKRDPAFDRYVCSGGKSGHDRSRIPRHARSFGSIFAAQ